jgi:hypothetical protein
MTMQLQRLDLRGGRASPTSRSIACDAALLPRGSWRSTTRGRRELDAVLVHEPRCARYQLARLARARGHRGDAVVQEPDLDAVVVDGELLGVGVLLAGELGSGGGGGHGAGSFRMVEGLRRSL